jgi:hypothetical protein
MCTFFPRTMTTARFLPVPSEMMLLCAVMVFMGVLELFSQTPTATSASISVVTLNPSNVVMERRPYTTAFPATVPTPTYISVNRTNSTSAAIVLFSADYRTASGQRLTNNDLQQDLGTTQLSLDNFGLGVNVMFFEPGQSVGYLVFYPIRVNFQRNEDRILTINVLPSRPGFGQQYSVLATMGTVSLTLKDNTTASSQPFLLNAVQNTSMTTGSVTLIEIETPGTRTDGLPSRVFGNENGSPLTYSTASLNPDIVRSEIVPAISRPNSQTGLRLTAVSTGTARILIVAVDALNRAATALFDVSVQVARQTTSVPTSVREESLLNAVQCSPNPAQDVLLISGLPPRSMCRLITTSGQELRRWKNEETLEMISLQELPQGAYLLVVEVNGVRTVQTILHQ